jgi:hypothetical protein
MFGDLEKAWGEADVLQLLRDYFGTADPKIKAGDYSVMDFNRHAQYLKQRRARQQQASPRTAANIEAAERAVGRRKP